jgi:hypothetical protein
VGAAFAGKQLKCKKCGRIFTAPAPSVHEESDESELRVADLLEDFKAPSVPAKAEQSSHTDPRRATDNPYESPAAALSPARPAYRRYSDVPWHRTSAVNSVFVIVGWLLIPPLLWWSCYNLLTGDVYYNDVENGKLKTWSKANKIAAGIFLLINTVALIRLLTNHGKF